MPDFNPGFLGIILWGIISYLFRKKKAPNDSQVENILDDDSSRLDYSDEIFYDQNTLDNSMLSIDQALEEIDPNVRSQYNGTNISPEIDKNINSGLDFKHTPKPSLSLSKMLGDSNNLKSAFILKEILDKPLALKEND